MFNGHRAADVGSARRTLCITETVSNFADEENTMALTITGPTTICEKVSSGLLKQLNLSTPALEERVASTKDRGCQRFNFSFFLEYHSLPVCLRLLDFVIAYPTMKLSLVEILGPC